jgi:outer membrane protein TolC
MRKLILTTLLALTALSGLSAETYSLADYLLKVEANSKDLYLARTDQELAGVQEKLAKSQALPMVAGSAGYTRNFIDVEQPVAAYADPTTYEVQYVDVDVNSDNDFSFGVGLTQKIFDGAVFQAIQASKKYRGMTGTIYEATRQGILTAAKQLYYQTVLLEEVYKVNKTTEDLAYETYQDVKLKYDNELASELDLLQAEVNWKINIPETTKSARNRDVAMNNLKHMGGLEPDEDVILSDTLIAFPARPAGMDLGEVLGSRPDYQVLQQELELREINIKANRAQFYPSLSATAQYGWQASDDDFDLSDPTDVFSVGLELTIPIFYGGSRFAQMEQVRLEKDQTRINILKKQDEVQIEIDNLQLSLDESASRIESAQATLDTARKAYQIMEVSSKSGLATQLELKDARNSLDGAQLNYYSAIYDYLSAYFSWQQAIGEGDQLPPA